MTLYGEQQPTTCCNNYML